MDIKDTTINPDGTYSTVYTRPQKDVNGVEFTVIAETHTRTTAELAQERQNVVDRITSYQRYLAELDAELASVNQASGK